MYVLAAMVRKLLAQEVTSVEAYNGKESQLKNVRTIAV